MRDLKVHLGKRSYDILIDNGPLDSIAVECKQLLVQDRVWLITDENILQYYQNDLICSFDKENVQSSLF